MTLAKLEIKRASGPLPKLLALASPTYGPVDPRASKHLRRALMNACERGLHWVGDVSPDRMSFEAARNTAAKQALEAGADGIVWVDSDMIIPKDAIYRLVMPGLDFTSGMYFQRLPPFYPLVAKFTGRAFAWITSWPPEDILFEADGVGFGCAYTSAKLLRKMLELPEVKKKGEWFRRTRYSEDLQFCLSAAKVGVKPNVDTAIMCGHLGDQMEITAEVFKKLKEAGVIASKPGELSGVKLAAREAVR